MKARFFVVILVISGLAAAAAIGLVVYYFGFPQKPDSEETESVDSEKDADRRSPMPTVYEIKLDSPEEQRLLQQLLKASAEQETKQVIEQLSAAKAQDQQAYLQEFCGIQQPLVLKALTECLLEDKEGTDEAIQRCLQPWLNFRSACGVEYEALSSVEHLRVYAQGVIVDRLKKAFRKALKEEGEAEALASLKHWQAILKVYADVSNEEQQKIMNLKDALQAKALFKIVPKDKPEDPNSNEPLTEASEGGDHYGVDDDESGSEEPEANNDQKEDIEEKPTTHVKDNKGKKSSKITRDDKKPKQSKGDIEEDEPDNDDEDGNKELKEETDFSALKVDLAWPFELADDTNPEDVLPTLHYLDILNEVAEMRPEFLASWEVTNLGTPITEEDLTTRNDVFYAVHLESAVRDAPNKEALAAFKARPSFQALIKAYNEAPLPNAVQTAFHNYCTTLGHVFSFGPYRNEHVNKKTADMISLWYHLQGQVFCYGYIELQHLNGLAAADPTLQPLMLAMRRLDHQDFIAKLMPRLDDPTGSEALIDNLHAFFGNYSKIREERSRLEKCRVPMQDEFLLKLTDIVYKRHNVIYGFLGMVKNGLMKEPNAELRKNFLYRLLKEEPARGLWSLRRMLRLAEKTSDKIRALIRFLPAYSGYVAPMYKTPIGTFWCAAGQLMLRLQTALERISPESQNFLIKNLLDVGKVRPHLKLFTEGRRLLYTLSLTILYAKILADIPLGAEGKHDSKSSSAVEGLELPNLKRHLESLESQQETVLSGQGWRTFQWSLLCLDPYVDLEYASYSPAELPAYGTFLTEWFKLYLVAVYDEATLQAMRQNPDTDATAQAFLTETFKNSQHVHVASWATSHVPQIRRQALLANDLVS